MNPQVGVIERWAFLAGVTGVVASLLLIALYALVFGAGISEYEWTGPANDVTGAVSMGATIPVAFALRDLTGGGPPVRVTTWLAAAGMAVIVLLSVLLVARVIPFEVQAAGAIPSIVVVMVWLAVLGWAASRNGSLPYGLARAAVLIGVTAVAGLVVVGASLLLPTRSVAQYVVGGVGVLLGGPAYLAFPVWLIVLSFRIGSPTT
ncbi:MAG: hypothetical protein ACRDUA_01090 [Micromonosporaceae bacterium]